MGQVAAICCLAALPELSLSSHTATQCTAKLMWVPRDAGLMPQLPVLASVLLLSPSTADRIWVPRDAENGCPRMLDRCHNFQCWPLCLPVSWAPDSHDQPPTDVQDQQVLVQRVKLVATPAAPPEHSNDVRPQDRAGDVVKYGDFMQVGSRKSSP